MEFASVYFLLSSFLFLASNGDGLATRRPVHPTVMFCVFVHNQTDALPYFLGNVEELDYPKDRLHWFIRILSGTDADQSAEMIRSWTEHVRPFYGTIKFDIYNNLARSKATVEESVSQWQSLTAGWRDEALFTARSLDVEFVLFVDCDVLLTNPKTLHLLLAEQQTIVAPMLRSVSRSSSNFWDSVDLTNASYVQSEFHEALYERKQQGIFIVPMVSSAVLVNLTGLRDQRLSFRTILTNDTGVQEPVTVLTVDEQLVSSKTRIHLLNKQTYGYVIPKAVSEAAVSERQEHLRYLALESIIGRSFNLHYSPFFEKAFAPEDNFGFDQVYVINLKRRPDRRRKVLACFRLLGVNATVIDAVDGTTLTMKDLDRLNVRQMKDYRDPYKKRPLTAGEIGCFLSHFHVWQDVVRRRYDRVLVFEDDPRFVFNFRRRLKTAMDELEGNAIYWDLLYLGRKPMAEDDEETLVPGCAHIQNVGYTYWTVSYALTWRGARKLLEAEPLQRMVPADEYLPIMYDRHPNKLWKEQFSKRHLKAFSVKPLLIYPTHYVGNEGYISDTEDAKVFEPKKADQNETKLKRVRQIRDEL